MTAARVVGVLAGTYLIAAVSFRFGAETQAKLVGLRPFVAWLAWMFVAVSGLLVAVVLR